MAHGVLLIAETLAQEHAEACTALAERLRLRGTQLIVIAGAPAHRSLLRALTSAGADASRSWLLCADPLWCPAAATAGLCGVVGLDVALPEVPGLITATCHGVADVTRVMVPPQGGCWHDPRSAPARDAGGTAAG